MVVPVLWSWVWCCAKMVSDKKWTFCSRIFHTTNHDRAIWRVSTPPSCFVTVINRGGCCCLCRPSYAAAAVVHSMPYFARFLQLALLAIVFGGVRGFGRCVASALTGRRFVVFSAILCYHSLASDQWDSFMEQRTSWMFGPFTLYIGCIHFVDSGL